MAEQDFSPAQQLLGHLDSLRAAGVEWLPAQGQFANPEPMPEREAQATPTALPISIAPTPTPSLGDLFSSAPAALQVPIEERRTALATLRQRVAECTRCSELARTRKQTVFGVGPLSPEICFVGEAPGANEDEMGEPFVGEAGQLLNRIIAACGMQRSDVYICNIIRCRPPGNRLPLPDEAGHCREFLEAQLALVAPRFICALGACAAQNLLDSKMPIGRLRGRFHDYKGTPVLCTYHPAYLLRSPEKKKDVWEDMKVLLTRMGRAIPTTR